MNVIQTESQLRDFISDEANDLGNISIRGVARLCDVSPQSIIEAAHFKSQKLGQNLVLQGFEAAHLLENGFPPQAVWLCIEYFAYDSKAKAPMAKQLARTFGSIGILATIKHLKAEPQTVVQQLPPKRDYIEHLDASDRIAKISNPMLRSLLEQAQMEALSVPLLAANKEDDLVLAAVLARELGFKLKVGQDAQLGKFAKSLHEPSGKAQHGRYEVNVYKRSQIEETVKAFFR